MLTGLLAQRGFGFLIDFLLKCQLACSEQKKSWSKIRKKWGKKNDTQTREHYGDSLYFIAHLFWTRCSSGPLHLSRGMIELQKVLLRKEGYTKNVEGSTEVGERDDGSEKSAGVWATWGKKGWESEKWLIFLIKCKWEIPDEGSMVRISKKFKAWS